MLFFNRELKNQYYWLPKGLTSSVVSTFVTGRWSMISVIMSNGEFILLIIEDTENTKKFWDFFVHIILCNKLL